MIISDKNKLEVYYKYNSSLYTLLILLTICFSFLSIALLFEEITFKRIVFFFISIILIYLCFLIPKKAKNKLEIKLTKEKIEIHKKRKVITIYTKDIICIGVLQLRPDDSIPQTIGIDYLDNNYKKTILYTLKGMNAINFTNIANNLINSNNEDYIVKQEENEEVISEKKKTNARRII